MQKSLPNNLLKCNNRQFQILANRSSSCSNVDFNLIFSKNSEVREKKKIIKKKKN